MPAVLADFCIKPRWIVPMTRRDELLEHHTLVMRDGRILDILPNASAADRYAPRVILDRPEHLLMPGLVNALTRTGSLDRAAAAVQFQPDGGLLCIANMLKAGITCFCDIGCFPRDAAQVAATQGMRALIGLPVAEHQSPWARNAGEYLTRALGLRDEYKGHPCISTGFAPLEPGAMSDATYARIGTLADELDAAILISLHESRSDVEESLTRHGLRPLGRLDRLGLLSPALCAAHLAHVNPADIELAQRGGIGVALCLQSDLLRGGELAPVAALAAAGLRLSMGSDGANCGNDQDVWTEMRLLALHSRGGAPGVPRDAKPSLSPWDVLAAATRGGAGVLGLDTEIGTLETGKWADLCCLDLSGPATQPFFDPMRQLVFSGGRDMVSDVWVAGRQLLCDRQFTRLDWPSLSARLEHTAPVQSPISEGGS
jgi:5-methylthioadenosine/S-adenosylhomocysteine deaminase